MNHLERIKSIRPVKKYRFNFIEERLMPKELVEEITNEWARLKEKFEATVQQNYVFDYKDYRVIAYYKLQTNEHVLKPEIPSEDNTIENLNKRGVFVYLCE